MEKFILVYLKIGSPGSLPLHILSAPGIGKDALTKLRSEVDAHFLDGADSPIVTNYQVEWKVIGMEVVIQLYQLNLSLVDNEVEMIRQCHNRYGRPGGNDLASEWLPKFLLCLTPFDTTRGELIYETGFNSPQVVVPEGRIVVSGYNYHPADNEEQR